MNRRRGQEEEDELTIAGNRDIIKPLRLYRREGSMRNLREELEYG